MIDKEAIKELQKGGAIEAAASALDARDGSIVALPNDFSVHDLEKYGHLRRRIRGAMTTSVAEHFAAYAGTHAEEGASVFVDPDTMAATAVLNLGTPNEPGHADNTATLKLRQTAPYAALLARANGQPAKQTDMAEFFEDWSAHIVCTDTDGAEIETRRAVAALRRITIESARKVESAEGSLSAERSAFEAVKASSTEPIPAFVTFRCEPYQGLAQRPFVSRLGILTGGDKPALILRSINLEAHKEQMADELANLVASVIGAAMPVHIGSYTAKR